MSDTMVKPSVTNEEELYRRARAVIPGGVSRNVLRRKPHPRYAAYGKGAYVTGVDGVARADFANNIASMIHGHAHPAIVAAVTEQVAQGTGFTLGTEAEIRHAELLCARSPSFERIRFMNSGTEAVMAAIKLARAATGRPAVAKAEGAYHGGYDFAETSQQPGPAEWGPIDQPASVPLVRGVPPEVLGRTVVFPFNDIERTIRLLDRHADEIACVIIDPCPHRLGFLDAEPRYIAALRDWTTRNGALLVFDEVIAFRLAYEGAQERYPEKPDLTTMGKIIGGGFPVGALAGAERVMRLLDPGDRLYAYPLSGTFSANPVTMVAGRVAMELYDRAAVNRLAELTAKMMAEVRGVIRETGTPACVTGSGTMFKIHLRPTAPTHYRESFEPPAVADLAQELIGHLYEKRVIVTHTLAAMPSTVIGDAEVELLLAGLRDGFPRILARLEKALGGAR